MIVAIMKVSENSLYPRYQDGDFVIISKIPIFFSGYHTGDVVVFNHPIYGRMIKKIDHLSEGGKALFVIGENDASIDSRRFGAIPAEWVVGKVIWHVGQK